MDSYKRLLALCLLVLAGCDSPTAKDGYKFEQETFTRTEFPVEVVLFKDEKQLQLAYRNRTKATRDKAGTIAAFAVIRTNNPKCTIYMLDPKTNYQPEFIGHEFVHCIYGEWHR